VDAFLKLKKEADGKNNKNVAFCYKRVLTSLSKYPMPILCTQQIQYLEGVGDTVACRFTEMIK